MTAPVIKVIDAKKILDRPFNGKYGLSPRQVEGLELALRGLPRSQIAKEMNITEGAVRAHLDRALRRIGISKSELGWWVLGRVKEVLK